MSRQLHVYPNDPACLQAVQKADSRLTQTLENRRDNVTEDEVGDLLEQHQQEVEKIRKELKIAEAMFDNKLREKLIRRIRKGEAQAEGKVVASYVMEHVQPSSLVYTSHKDITGVLVYKD